jgi:glucose/arabinose dehydrogenase
MAKFAMMKNKLRAFIGVALLMLSLAACQVEVEEPLFTSTNPVEPAVISATETQISDLEPTQAAQVEVTATLPPTEPASTETQPATETLVAGSLPDPSAVQWTAVLRDLNQPIFISGAGDSSGRLFAVLQTGQIVFFREGSGQAEPFLDISDRTSTGSLGERGLLGLAFHPRFAENGYFYVNYTDRNDDTHISRFSVSAENPDQADPDSELELLFVDQPYRNHNGGGLTFGPDGMLYVALGDGGSAGDPQGNGQSLQTLLGKILRLDVDAGSPYAIPRDNPFVAGGGRGEIWAYGLRNPWRIAFDALTGDLYIADVGQNAYEEINFQPADSQGGENYGWKFREGRHPFQGTPGEALQLIDPVAEYSHGDGCSVTGGVVYRGTNLPEWQGVYLYGDYCSGRIWGLRRNADGAWENDLLFQSGFTISSFGTDDSGNVYVIDYGPGVIYRLDGE